MEDPPSGKYGNMPMLLPRLDKGKVQTQAKTRSSTEGAGFFSRPKSAHASAALGAASQMNTNTNGSVVKRASRKLSFSASFPFGNRDKQREKEKVQQ